MDKKQAGDDIRITRAIVGALRGRDLTGFEIWQWLGPIHGATGQLTEAALYPTLYRLEAAGLIEGRWSEDERTRRKYRITATGHREAAEQGWTEVAFRRRRGAPQPNEDGEWSWPSDPAGEPGSAQLGTDAPADSPEATAAAAYIRRLGAALELSIVDRTDVRDEIDDHLADSSARLNSLGAECADAMDQAIAGLGPADLLAIEINAAQLTKGRLRKGLSWGSAVGMLSALVGLVLTWTLLTIFSLLVVGVVVGIGSEIGVHLYAPITSEWHAEELGLAGWVGAFVGARRSMPHLALRSRRSEHSIWRTWALIGAVPLTTAAILLPVSLDPLVVLTLFGIPAAWVLGTLHPSPLYGATITSRGAVLGGAIVLALLLFPGTRVWSYDPAAGPPAGAPFTRDESAHVTWDGSQTSATWRVTIDLGTTPGWHDARLEVWPAVRSNVGIGPDSSAKAPSIDVGSGGLVNLNQLPRSVPDWWSAVTAVGPDGQRHSVAVAVRYGHPTHVRTNIVGWLIGLVRH